MRSRAPGPGGGEGSSIWATDVGGHALRRLTYGQPGEDEVTWSRVGPWVAFPRGGIFVARTDRNTGRQVTTFGRDPDW